jgi:hypothetical protein
VSIESLAIGPCPHCQSQLESGHLGYASGLFWSRQRLNWWQSLFFFAFFYGQFVVGNLASTPWFQSRAGHRCTGCGALVIPTDR